MYCIVPWGPFIVQWELYVLVPMALLQCYVIMILNLSDIWRSYTTYYVWVHVGSLMNSEVYN
jgi:hypothetical protein